MPPKDMPDVFLMYSSESLFFSTFRWDWSAAAASSCTPLEVPSAKLPVTYLPIHSSSSFSALLVTDCWVVGKFKYLSIICSELFGYSWRARLFLVWSSSSSPWAMLSTSIWYSCFFCAAEAELSLLYSRCCFRR